MDSEKPKFDWQRSLITAGIVLLSALVVGGVTWYVMDKSARDVKTANDQSVAALQKQINELKTVESTSTKTTNNTGGTATNTATKEFKHSSPTFSFTYPSTLIATSDTVADPAIWLSTDGTRANTTLSLIFEPTKNIDPQLFFEAKVKDPGVPSPYSVIGNITVGNKTCYEVDFTHQGLASTSLYFYANGYTYTASFPTAQKTTYLDVIKSLSF